MESTPEGSAPTKAPEPARSTPPQRADPSAFLHPKNYVPRGAPALTPAPRHSGISGPKPTERRSTTTTGEPPAADEIVLTLGDVLSRIPTHYLKQGSPDAKRELRFRINDLSSDIARGRAAVPLSRIAQLVPDIFVKEIGRDEDTEVRLPLQKLVEQIGLLRSRPKPSVVEKPARPSIAVEMLSSARPVVGAEARKETSPVASAPIELPPTADQKPPSPAVAPPQDAPIILSEPPLKVQRTFELKPVVDQTLTPVILGPSPVVEPPPTVSVPPEPQPSTPAATEAVQPVEPEKLAPEPLAPALEPTALAAEPVEPTPEPEPATPLDASEPAKIVIDWASVAAPVAEPAPEPPPVESAVEPVHAEAPADAPKFVPLESTELETGTEMIHLNLAAILRHCPPEIVVGALPHVDDSVRITLPFAPIDRQLIKGRVEVSALRFVGALPEAYQKYFVAKMGVKVPIPLEEVFQNLPAPSHDIAASAVGPPPIYLAPAPHAEPAPITPTLEDQPAEMLSSPADESAAAAVSSAVSAEPIPSVESKVPEPEAPPVGLAPPAEPEHDVPSGADAPAISLGGEEKPATSGHEDALASRFSLFPPPEPAVSTDQSERPAIELPFEPLFPPAEESVPNVEETHPPVAASLASEATPTVPPAIPPLPASLFATIDAPTDAPVVATPAAEADLSEAPAAAPAEAAAVAPAPDHASPPPADSAAEPPKLVLQPPGFRPFFVPPPRIFGFAPTATPAAEESEAVAPPTPPSLFTALAPSPALADAHAAAAGNGAQPAAHAAPPANDFEPSAELIASAPEDAEPETLGTYATELVPFADLADTLAIETTYAEAHAAVVHIDEYYTRPAEPETPLVAEAVAPPAEEDAGPSTDAHPTEIAPPAETPVAPAPPAEPVVEALAAAAAVATVIELAPHPAATPEHAEVAAQIPAAPEPAVTEPAAAEPQVAEPPPAIVAPAVQSAVEPPVPPAAEAPAEPPAPVEPAPPPHPLFPVPRHPVEHAHLEVLPPPSLPLRRFDQDAVQALFMTEETLDLPKISRLAASLPGVYACVIATRDQACTGGTLPEGFDLAALLGLAPRVGEAAGRMPIGQLKHFTLYGEAYSVSFFERHGLSLCAVHRPRSFVPGVREKLVALADELSR